MRSITVGILLLGLLNMINAQITQSNNPYTIQINQTPSPIILDGVLDEAAWQKADLVSSFYQNFPFDTSYADEKTLVRVTFDAQFLYIGAQVFQAENSLIISSLRRDFDPGTSDDFSVNIDPFQDQLNGFHFGVSAFNIQREGLIDNGDNVPLDWDNKWYSQVKRSSDSWTVEMAIPFKTLRYKRTETDNIWRISFSRRSIKKNEVSAWPPVPRQFDVDHLAFTALMEWQNPPPKPGANISLIPFMIANTERDFEFNLPGEQNFDVGMDAKIGVTPSLNLDLTINPDFSQVEVDRQLTNLSRFELFFPERRQFFLENEDLFSRFGFPGSRPFFSRRIGLASGTIQKTNTAGDIIEVNRSLNVPIIAGARLSGKLDNNWRIGLLNMHTAEQEDLNRNPANYSVAVLQRKVQKRSVLGAFFVNQENYLKNGDGDFELDRNGFSRAAGIEYNFFSEDNKWESEAFYHRSFNAEDNRDAQAAGFYLGYNTRELRIFAGGHYVGDNHQVDMGFIPRTGFVSTFNNINYSIYPNSDKVNQIRFQLENNFTYNKADSKWTDRSHGLNGSIVFPGQSEFSIGIQQDYTYLFFSFDPTNSDGVELAEGTEYTYNSFGASYDSDFRKRFFYSLSISGGQFFNGNILNLSGEINYRLQPYGTFSIAYEYNNISLPEPYNSADFWLVGPRAELALSRSIFWSTFLQYNTQADNININSRLQWRFQPASDIFLVYTNNYFTNEFFENPREKNRALVFKISYWLNL